MATQVNLSSREWCDLVFEGKNKDFGAYVIRTESPRRHNQALLLTIIGAIIFGLITFGFMKANQYVEKRSLANQGEQVGVIIDMSQGAEEPEKQQELIQEIKSEEPAVEELKTYQATELQIVEDEKVNPEDQILSQDEQMATDGFAGRVTNSDGSTDLNDIQGHINEVVVEEEKPVLEKPTNQVFQAVEQMPQFPGGEEALMKYLASHLNYPPMAVENNTQGKVVVQFIVDKTGKVGEVKVVRSVDKELDKEAVRVCMSLPKFVPGRQNGQAVSVWYTLPVTFKLQGIN